MMSSRGVWAGVALLLAGLAGGAANVQAESGTSSKKSAVDHDLLEQVMVVGKRDQMYAIPGSAHYIDYDAIRGMSYDDINRVLRQVPGVYLREEDGYGLFPNISLRGVDTSRSAKVTLMEDGILAAPAPYAAPSAYYSPTTGRMSGIEVLKGTSQVKYGPHITGGVINYLSTPIPEQAHTFLRAPVGSNQDYRLHAFHGNTVDTKNGRVGYLVEAYVRSTDGFKTIDPAPGVSSDQGTGFTNIEPMIKLSWEPGTTLDQRFEFKLGYSDKEADETYLGLAPADLAANPFRRYSASRFDNIETEHLRTYLRHFVAVSESINVVTTAYYNNFSRNWYKLNDIRSTPGGLGENLSLSAALAGASGGEGLACLKGETACGLRVRANNRRYVAQGIQSEVNFDLGSHALSLGVRLHNDIEDRFQWQDVYQQSSDGAIVSVAPGQPGSQDDREAETQALAIYLQDTITLGNWTIQPGLRYEHLDATSRDYRNGRSVTDGEMNLFSGGIGLSYALNEEWQLLGGVHAGFSPPGPRGIIAGINEETSTGVEAGFRFTDNNALLLAEVIGFYTAFDDLVVVSNIGGTGTGVDENFGEVRAFGLEVSSTLDIARLRGAAYQHEAYVTFTYTEAEQGNDALSTDAESIFSFGAEGNQVPYIPQYQLTLGTSASVGRWSANASWSYVDETFTSASNVTTQTNGLLEPDARFGKTDAYNVVDVSLNMQATSALKLFAGVHNLLGDEYIVSRQPHGPRPGRARAWFAGVELELR